jgi:Tfp pilus assembly protein PilN
MIAANLLPLEIVESRRDRRVRGVVLAALVSFVAVLVAWYALSAYQTKQARTALATAQQSGDAVLRQQRNYSDVVNVQAESTVITTQLASLLANDLQWSRLLDAVVGSAPDGVALTAVTGALTPAVKDAGSTAIVLPNTSGQRQIGTLTISGTTLEGVAVATYVDALGKIKGLGNPLLGGVTAQNGILHFTVQLDITSGALGGRYPATSGSGGN